MIVTTLPICFRTGRPFRILFTAFVAKCLGRLLGAHVYYPINLMGIRNHLTPHELEPTRVAYCAALNDLGIRVLIKDVLSDMDKCFLSYVHDITDVRIKKGICVSEPVQMAYCMCGRVELPAHVLSQLKEQDRMKLTKALEGRLVCSTCDGEIMYGTHDVLLHQQEEAYHDFSIFPSWLKSRKDRELKHILSRRYAVTRRYRPQGASLQLASGLAVDPDYCWGHQLSFLSEKSGDEEIMLVVGMTHIAQASRAITLAQSVRPTLQVSLVVHPMVDFCFTGAFPDPTMSAEEFVWLCGSSSAALITLSFAFQWNRERSNLDLNEFPLIEKSLRGKVIPTDLLGQSERKSVEAAVTALKRFNIQNALKGLRQRRVLSVLEQELIQAIVA